MANQFWGGGEHQRLTPEEKAARREDREAARGARQLRKFAFIKKTNPALWRQIVKAHTQ